MYEFDTPQPVRLRIDFGAGDIDIDATDVTTTTVRLDGDEDLIAATTVEQRGNEIRIDVPRRPSLFRRSAKLSARIVTPAGSHLDAKVNSADLTTSGRLADARIRSGSGGIRLDAVDGEASIQSGSGDVEIAETETMRIQTGSGDVYVRTTRDDGTVTTGSGDIRLEATHQAMQASTGSGDVRVDNAYGEIKINTASGDQTLSRVHRGQVQCRAASGDIRVGVAKNVAVWLDVNSLSGSVYSQLESSEPPAEGEETVQLQATSVSGNLMIGRA